MRSSRFSDEQIIGMIKEQEAGMPIAEFVGLEISHVRNLKALKDENATLKNLLVEQMLDNAMLKDVNSKKW